MEYQKEGERTKLHKIILALSGTVLYIMAIIYNHGTRLTAGVRSKGESFDHYRVVGAFTVISYVEVGVRLRVKDHVRYCI